MLEKTNRQASLHFVERSADSYLSVMKQLYAQDQRTFLIRPCSAEAKTVLKVARLRFIGDVRFFRDSCRCEVLLGWHDKN